MIPGERDARLVDLWRARADREMEPVMIQDFFRGYPKAAWRNEIALREARVQAIVDRYAQTLDAALHQDQSERMRALTIAGGDVRIAKHLLYGQVLFDTDRISG